MVFPKTIRPKTISVSVNVIVSALLFPPRDVKIWGGTDPGHLVLLDHFAPPGDTANASEYMVQYERPIKSVPIKYIKVSAETIGRLPKQYITPKDPKDKKPRKKEDDMGWLFVDEIFVY